MSLPLSKDYSHHDRSLFLAIGVLGSTDDVDQLTVQTYLDLWLAR